MGLDDVLHDRKSQSSSALIPRARLVGPKEPFKQPFASFWRDARVERIWDGTSEIQRHIISRDLLRPLGG